MGKNFSAQAIKIFTKNQVIGLFYLKLFTTNFQKHWMPIVLYFEKKLFVTIDFLSDFVYFAEERPLVYENDFWFDLVAIFNLGFPVSFSFSSSLTI